MVCTVIWGVMTYCVLIDIFTIEPTTQYVWINQTATFTCATNVTGYILSFSISASVDHIPTVTDLPEGGLLATCSYTVTSYNNGTSVRCLATNNGGLPVASDPAGLLMDKVWSTHAHILSFLHHATIPGPPSSVVDLTAVQHVQECSIFVSWEPPYLLPGLTVSYKVYINGEMIQDDISTTNYIYMYYPMKLTNTTYNVTVKAFNDSIIGDATSIEALYQTSTVNMYNYIIHWPWYSFR